jgi:uncharacterized protein
MGSTAIASETTPFILAFATQCHRYFYDVNTSSLFQVDELTQRLLLAWRTGCDPGLLERKFADAWPIRIVRQHIAAIRGWERRGYLSSFRPRGLRFPFDRSGICDQLATRMHQLQLEVSESCNLRCRYCVYSGTYRNYRPHGNRLMSTSTAMKALDFFWRHSGDSEKRYVSFYGGEPLLNFPVIAACVRRAYKSKGRRRVMFSITTNGTQLSDEVVRFLAEHKVFVRVSLDGPAPVHNSNRVTCGGKGAFRAVMANLAHAKQVAPDWYGSHVSLSAVIAPPYDFLRLRRFFEREPIVRDCEVSFNGVGMTDTCYYEQFSEDELAPKGYAEVEHQYIRASLGESPLTPFLRGLFQDRMVGLHRRVTRRQFAEYEYPNGVCLPGTRRLFVTVNGRFQPCERLNQTIHIGDVERGIDVDAVCRLIDRYISISSAECTRCWALGLCRACFAAANSRGLSARAKRAFCDSERESTLSALIRYCSILERNPRAFGFMNSFRIVL